MKATTSQQLLEIKGQGRTFHLTSMCTDSNHWIASGGFTSFSEYCFAIKACLNLPLMKSVVKRAGKQIDVTCPLCKAQLETLAHVL